MGRDGRGGRAAASGWRAAVRKDLHDLVRARLAPHKTPKAWYAVDEVPANALGKLQKFRLRDQALAGLLRNLDRDDA
jgi:acyl-coenzyme A synthetase/AMP-(fatty) acid ligase